MSTLRLQNIEKNKQRILSAAQKIIIEKGIDALSVRGLASASNLALRTIYNLYGNKEKVVIAVLEQGTQGIEKGISELENAITKGPWKTEYYLSWIHSLERVFLDNKKLLKPALLAGSNLDRYKSKFTSAMHQRRIQQFQNIFQLAADRNLIRKDLCIKTISKVLYDNYFNVVTKWAQDEIEDQELVTYGRYNVLLILYTLINESSRRENVLSLMKEIEDQGGRGQV